MTRSISFIGLAVVALAVLTPISAKAQTETTIFRFTDGSPNDGLVADAAGNLYGTEWSGGANFFGSVFKLSKDSSGAWSEAIIYSFQGPKVGDGNHPLAGLTFDTKGNMYGTTEYGGVGGFCFYGCGTVYVLAPQPDGTWKERVIHRFYHDVGGLPQTSVTLDAEGNVYGVASPVGGGTAGYIYELSPGKNGIWAETVLYIFPSTKSNQGTDPDAPVIFDGAGNLYGTAFSGGQHRSGVVFKLSPGSSGWTYSVLHVFGTPGDGANPSGGLVFDASGNLYGTTRYGGSSNVGIAFELSPTLQGRWAETIIHDFSATDGDDPLSSMIIDAAGNLYGAAPKDGEYGFGSVFELSPLAGGWNWNVLHAFNGSDGSYPEGPLVEFQGNFYSVADGAAFEITP